MRSLLLPFLLFSGLAAGAVAQSQLDRSCPMISIDGPTEMNFFGDRIRLKAKITPLPTSKLTYVWTLTSGAIIGDPTASEVKIEATVEPDCHGTEVVVELKIGGLDNSCPSTATDNYLFFKNCDHFPIDEYQSKAFTGRDKGALDNLAIQMSNNPGLKGFVIFEVKSDASEKAARVRAKKIKQFAFEKRKYPRDRLIFLLKRSDLDRTVIWLWPSDFTSECGNCEAL